LVRIGTLIVNILQEFPEQTEKISPENRAEFTRRWSYWHFTIFQKWTGQYCVPVVYLLEPVPCTGNPVQNNSTAVQVLALKVCRCRYKTLFKKYRSIGAQGGVRKISWRDQ